MPKKLKYILTFFAGGIAGCAVLVISLYFVFVHDRNRFENTSIPYEKEAVESMLDELVKKIEFYKQVNGYYPKRLSDVRMNYNDIGMFIDPASLGGKCIYEYYYHPADKNNSYTLRSPGDDRIIFTDDDILPPIALEHIDKLGILVDRQDNVNYPEVRCYEIDKH